MSFYDTPLYKTFVPLGLCGICMGLGIASKWTGIYAGCGLALLFFAHLLRRYREYLYAKAHPGKSTNGMEHQQIVKKFPDYTVKTIDFCLTFFVLVPAVIYLLSYLPFVDNSHPGLFDRMLTNQTSMFNYHSGLEATHPYSSSWYQWPTMVRPIWYYSGYLTDAVKEGISAFGNPLVWWGGIPAFLYVLYLLVTHSSFLRALTGKATASSATTPLSLFPQCSFCGTDDRVQPDATEKAGIQPHFCSHLLCLCRAGLRSVPAVLSGTFGSAGGCGFCSKILTLAGYLGVDLGLSHFYNILL